MWLDFSRRTVPVDLLFLLQRPAFTLKLETLLDIADEDIFDDDNAAFLLNAAAPLKLSKNAQIIASVARKMVTNVNQRIIQQSDVFDLRKISGQYIIYIIIVNFCF